MSIEAAGDRRLWEPANEFSRLYAAGDETGAVDVAVEALRGGVSFAPPLESIWWLADQLRQRRHYALGLALADAAFERGFRSWRIFYLRGLFCALLRNFPKALNLLDTAIGLAPPDAAREMNLLKGRFLAAAGDVRGALRCLKASIEFGRDPVRVVDAAIRIAWRAEEGDLARRWTGRADKDYGVSFGRSKELARQCFDRGLWEQSRTAAQAGLKIEAENRFLLRILCRCFHSEGKIPAAISALENALKVDPDWTEGRILLARCLGMSGRRREAARALAGAGESADDAVIASIREEFGLTDEDFAEGGSATRRRDPLEDPELVHRLNNIPSIFVPSWTKEKVAATGNSLRATRVLFHSVWTIMLREMMARFGRHDLGYLWAVIEPLVHVLVLSSLFYFMRMRDSLGMNPVLFVATGIIPLFFYMKTVGVLTNALKQNRHLLNHAHVQPMDIFLGRAVLEFFTQLLVLILFAVCIYVVIEPYRFGSVFWVVANLFGLWIFGIGVGLTVGSLVIYAEWLPTIMSGFNRIVYISSGVFFTLEMMPPTMAKYAAYNPLLHFVDGVRGNFSSLMGGDRIDIAYGYMWAVAILAMGLIADRALRHKVLDR